MGKRTNTAKWLEKQKRWQIKVQKDGERRTFTSSTPGRTGQREANAKADAWLDENIQGGIKRVQVYFDQWVESLKLTTSKGNWRPIVSRWENHIGPSIATKRLESLVEQDLQNVIDKAYSKGLSKKSLKSIMGDMRQFLKYCRKLNATKFNPENLTIPAAARNKEKTVLQPNDLVKLFNIDTSLYRGERIFDDHIYAYRFQVITGLRPGELIGLKWSDIKGDTVNVRRSINRDNEVTKGKNENAVRSFKLSVLARDAIESQRDLQLPGEQVFPVGTEAGHLKRWTRYCEANGITRTTLYEMRHTFVSVVKRLPPGLIKPVIGHAQNMDTFGVYGHALNDDADNTAKQINDVFTFLIKTKSGL